MGVLRGIGYFIAILILIGGIILFPLGLVLIIPAIIMIWALHKGGQVTNMQKSMKHIERMEAENQQLQSEKMQRDALADRKKLENGWDAA